MPCDISYIVEVNTITLTVKNKVHVLALLKMTNFVRNYRGMQGKFLSLPT